MKSLFVVAVTGLALAACGGSPDVNNAQESETFTRTVVHLNGDKPADVKTTVITAAEREHDLASFERHADSEVLPHVGQGLATQTNNQDYSCAASSVWMWDTNKVHEICFSGIGDADLTTYVRYTAVVSGHVRVFYWSQSVAEYWPGQGLGSQYGFLSYYDAVYCYCWVGDSFNPNGPDTYSGYGAAHATKLTLY